MIMIEQNKECIYIYMIVLMGYDDGDSWNFFGNNELEKDKIIFFKIILALMLFICEDDGGSLGIEFVL